MGAIDRAAAAAVTSLATLGFCLAAVVPGIASASPRGERPDVIVIQTDDQTAASLRATFRTPGGKLKRVMPHTMDLIAARGAEFTSHYVSNPVCTASRASFWSGQYSHNNGVFLNFGPTGGWEGYRAAPIHDQNLATSLQKSGYRTVHFGKFISEYASREIPPGWDRWMSDYEDYSIRSSYGYMLNDQGVIKGPVGARHYADPRYRDRKQCRTSGRPCRYHTDLVTAAALRELKRRSRRPLYLQLDLHSPHVDGVGPDGPEPAARHYGTAAGTSLVMSPNFDEADVSDKVPLMQEVMLSRQKPVPDLELKYQKVLESLRSVDESVNMLTRFLKKNGRLGNTYVIFTSDNGEFTGDHGISYSKFLAYEESARVPLLIRGPGIPPGTVESDPTANVDLAPTILAVTGTPNRLGADGRSLRGYWTGYTPPARRPVLLESGAELSGYGPEPFSAGDDLNKTLFLIPWSGLRVGPWKYIAYGGDSGDELYDLENDPYELQSLSRRPEYQAVRQYLAQALLEQLDCAGAECRAPLGRWPAVAPG